MRHTSRNENVMPGRKSVQHVVKRDTLQKFAFPRQKSRRCTPLSIHQRSLT